MKLIERQKNFMNTVITIKVVRHDESTVAISEAIENAFGEFDRIVKKYTRFNEDSELSNLNRMNGEWVKVSDEFFMLIKYMLTLAKKTKGAFDPTIIDFLEVYGYDKNYDFSKLDNPKLNEFVENIAKTRRSFKEIELDAKQKKVKLAKTQRIDLGGVGKGYAIDCAYEKLAEVADNFLIDAGGDIRVKGKNDKGKWWRAGLLVKDEKGETRNVGEVELKDEALACSGSWARRVKQFHHIIDPKSGKPVAKKYNTVFVQSPDAITADSWATALFVGDSALLKSIPSDTKVRFW